ncbi:hypothetical protein BB561_004002 [Smittium simulii]|uniref:SEC7 domain-containing protein n=1 Tax=Smittium simulii TaxID=133385 RepID=A0A2T9YIM7_9FUNG|nr:hypothetical protein BB561_004002 [Smittium simulii]
MPTKQIGTEFDDSTEISYIKRQSAESEAFETARLALPPLSSFLDHVETIQKDSFTPVNSSDTQLTYDASKDSSELFVLINTTSNKKRYVENKATESYRWVLSKFKKDSTNSNKYQNSKRTSISYKNSSNLSINSSAIQSTPDNSTRNNIIRKTSIAIPTEKSKTFISKSTKIVNKMEQGSDNHSTVNSSSTKLRKTSFWALLKSPRIRSGNNHKIGDLSFSLNLPNNSSNDSSSSQKKYSNQNNSSTKDRSTPTNKLPQHSEIPSESNYLHTNHTFPKFPNLDDSNDAFYLQSNSKSDKLFLKLSEDKKNLNSSNSTNLKSLKISKQISQENSAYTLGLNRMKENMKKLNHEIKSKRASSSNFKNNLSPRIVPSKSEANLSHIILVNSKNPLLTEKSTNITIPLSHHHDHFSRKSFIKKSNSEIGPDVDSEPDLNDILLNKVDSKKDLDLRLDRISDSKRLLNHKSSINDDNNSLFSVLTETEKNAVLFSKYIFDYYIDSNQRLDVPFDAATFLSFLGGTSLIHQRTLDHYINLFDFTDIDLESSLRKICKRLDIVGESQEIDRVLYAFAKRYMACNPNSLFVSVDITHLIVYSIFLLNTDLHIASLDPKSRMSRNRYVENTIQSLKNNNVIFSSKKEETLSLFSNTNESKKKTLRSGSIVVYNKDDSQNNKLSLSSKIIPPQLPELNLTSSISPTAKEFFLSPQSANNLNFDSLNSDNIFHTQPVSSSKLGSSRFSYHASATKPYTNKEFSILSPENSNKINFNYFPATEEDKGEKHHGIYHKSPQLISPNSTDLNLNKSFSQLSLDKDVYFEIDKKKIQNFLSNTYISIKSNHLEKPRSFKNRNFSQNISNSVHKKSNNINSNKLFRTNSTTYHNLKFNLLEDLTRKKNDFRNLPQNEINHRLDANEKIYNISILSKSSKSDIYNTQIFAKSKNRSSTEKSSNLNSNKVHNDNSFKGDTYFKDIENTEDHYLQPNQMPKKHANSETFSIRSSFGFEDSNIPVTSKLYYKIGLLNKKLLYEKVGKKTFNRSWRGCYVSIGAGKAMIYKGDAKIAPLSGIFNKIPKNSQFLSTVLLNHTYTQVMPAPGYSSTRPFVVALTMNHGSVILFQVCSTDDAHQWALTFNYWAAITSKVPYIAGGVNNVDYGWNNDIEFMKYNDQSLKDGANLYDSQNQGENSKADDYIKSNTTSNTQNSFRDYNRNTIIADWAPPPDPPQFSNASEQAQIKLFEKHLTYLESELVKHKVCLSTVPERFSPRSSIYTKAFRNWERKAQYLLKELVKYRSYIDCLKKALLDFDSRLQLDTIACELETSSVNSNITKSQKSDVIGYQSKEPHNSSLTNFPNISLPNNF